MKTTLSFLFSCVFVCLSFAQPPVISGDILLCPNSTGTAVVTDNQVYDSYTWYWKYWFTEDPFVPIIGANGPTFTYDWATFDQALLKVVVTLGGNSYESNTIQIDSYAWVGLTVGFEDTPNISIDTENGNVNLCQGTGFTVQVYEPYTIVQWYKDGVLIDGATNMELHVTEAGVYHVVAAPGFCPDSTASTEGLPIVVQIDTNCQLGIQQPDEMALAVYPNPVKDIAVISFGDLPVEKVSVYNLAGQVVYSNESVASINISGLPSGLYILEVNSGDKFQRTKLVKE